MTILLGIFGFSHDALAASRYWVGGGSSVNWNATSPTNWSASPGGSNDASVPSATDDVFFDGSSGTSNSVISASQSIQSLDMTGYTGTLTHNSSVILTVTGGGVVFKLASGMTYTLGNSSSAALSFTGSSGTTLITTAGKTVGSVTFNGAGGTYQLQDALTSSGSISLLAGTLDTNSQSVQSTAFGSNSSLSRTLTLGSTNFTVTGGGNSINFFDPTNLTMTANTGTFTSKGGGFSVNSQKDFNGMSLAWIAPTSMSSMTSHNSTFKDISFATNQSTNGLVLDDVTVTGTFSFTGSGSTFSRGLIYSNTFGTPATITAANVSFSNVDFRDITTAGAANWDLSAISGYSGDAGGNSGITFTPSQTNYWVCGTGNWTTAACWANSSGGTGGTGRYPLPQDDVRFDSNSFSSTGQIVTINTNVKRIGRNIDWTGVTNTPAWAKTYATTMYGSLTLASDMTNSGTTAITMEGRGSSTFTSAGQIFTNPITIAMIGGTLTMQDDFNTSSALTLSNGTLDANGHNITFPSISITGTSARGITMGSGTWTANGTGNVWNATATTSLTVTPNTSTIVVSDTSATTKTFIGGWMTYNNATFSGDNITVTGSNAFGTLAVNTAGLTNGLKLTSGTTQVISDMTTNGSSGSLAKLTSTSGGSAASLSKSSGIVSVDYMSLQDIAATGGASWQGGTNSDNVSGNTGWTFTSTQAPVMSIQSATSATTSATLNGTIESIGDSTPTERGFYFGTTASYGMSTSTTGSYSTGTYSLDLSNLDCGTTYHIQAFATNVAGTGTSTDSTFSTVACPAAPSAPQALRTTTASGLVNLYWSPPASTGGHTITDYLLEYKATSDPYSSWATYNDGVSTLTNDTIAGLTDGTSYDFRVSAINDIGTSVPSATSTIFAGLYNLNGGPYTVTDLGIMMQTNTLDRPVYYQLNGDTHLLLFYLTSYGTEVFQILDVNLSQGTYRLVDGASFGRIGVRGTVLHSNGKIYISSGEADGKGYFSEYDPATGDVRQIAQASGTDPGQYAEVGDDGWIYTGGYPNAFVDRYNPTTDVYERLGNMDTDADYAYTLGADSRYLYVGVGKIPWALKVYDTQLASSTMYWKTAGDSLGTVRHGTGGNWYYERITASPSYQHIWYQLTNGEPVQLASQPSDLLSSQKRGNVVDGVSYGGLVGYEVNLDDAYPNSANNSATILWRATGETDWQSLEVTNFNLTPSGISRLYVYPWDQSKLLVFSSFYGPLFLWNTSNNTASLLGYPQFDLSDAAFTSDTAYFSGYTAALLRYDPTKSWTLSGSSNMTSTSINPYKTSLSIGKHEYFDAVGSDGLIYVGARHERDSTGGEIGWYNPTTGVSSSLRTPFLDYDINDMVPALSATKMVYASILPQMFVFDVATKAVERTIVPVPGVSLDKVIEVRPGIVFGTAGSYIFEVNITDGSLIYSTTLPGSGFVEGGQEYNHRMALGPDGYIWMFRWYRDAQNFNVTSLYRINPDDGSYSVVLPNTYYTYGNQTPVFNGGDLYLYGGSHLYRVAGILSATVPTAIPTVSSLSASNVSTSTVTMNGSIDDIGDHTPTVRGFEYGLTTTYGTATSTSGSYSTGSYSQTLNGLACATTYHYHAYATNSDGSGAGGDIEFTTDDCSTDIQTVTVSDATSVDTTSATLNGSITVDNTASSTIRGFEYGLTTAYGTTTSTSGTYGIGAFTANLTDLTCSTGYHFRAFATNPYGTAYSADNTFTTDDCTVTSNTVTAPVNVRSSSVTSSSVVLAWDASNATLGVIGYNIYRDGTLIAVLNFGTTYTDTGLSASTAYSYIVTAVDNGSTESDDSAAFSTSTIATAVPESPPSSSTPSGGNGPIMSSSGSSVRCTWWWPFGCTQITTQPNQLEQTQTPENQTENNNTTVPSTQPKTTVSNQTQENITEPTKSPSILGSLGNILKNFTLSLFSKADKQKLPTEVVFAKPANLPSFDVTSQNSPVAQSANAKPEAQPQIHVLQGKSLDLAVKADRPVKQITGYLTIKKIDRQTAMNDLQNQKKQSQLAAAGATNGNKLVLETFTYTDPDGDGIYTATITAPKVIGQYDIMTVMEYQDQKLGYKELHMTAVVDPEGYVYEKSGNQQTRITNAKVTLLVKDSDISKFTIWPADQFKQNNPQTTDITGNYSFLVPEGTYQLTVSAPGYYDYTGAEFTVTQGAGVHENIELIKRHWWTTLWRWITGTL